MPVSRNSFDDDGWVLGKILDEALCSSFDCGDPDLNDYFHNEAILYSAELLTQRYYLYIPENPSKAIVLLDFCNDGLHVDQYKKAVQLHPDKEVHHLPAVKLTRFGVRKEYHRRHIGTAALNIVKKFFVTDNRTGCRLLIVDAYNRPEVLTFYAENGFQLFTDTDKDRKKPTRAMFFDLKRFVRSS